MDKSNWTEEQMDRRPVPMDDYRFVVNKNPVSCEEALVRLHLRNNSSIAGAYRNNTGEEIGEFESHAKEEHGRDKIHTYVELKKSTETNPDVPDIKCVYVAYDIGKQSEWSTPGETPAPFLESVVVQDSHGKKILDWMVKQKINKVNKVGRVMAQYYMDKDAVIRMAEKNKPLED